MDNIAEECSRQILSHGDVVDDHSTNALQENVGGRISQSAGIKRKTKHVLTLTQGGSFNPNYPNNQGGFQPRRDGWLADVPVGAVAAIFLAFLGWRVDVDSCMIPSLAD